MALPSNPAPDFCAACGFPLRGPRCEACGVDRGPAAARKAAGGAGDAAWHEGAVDAWRARDPVRFVGFCISAETGGTIQATSSQDGVGWIVPLGGVVLFVALDAPAERLSIDVPVARIMERQRVPILRSALELCDGPGPARLCLRDDLLLLRRVARFQALTPVGLRQALQASAEAGERLAATFSAWFDTRAPFTDEQRGNLTWAAAGRSRPLKSFSIPPPGSVRAMTTPSMRSVLPPPPPPPRAPLDAPAGEPSSWAAPPKAPESAARPRRQDESIPDILSPVLATASSPPSAPAPSSGSTTARYGGMLPPSAPEPRASAGASPSSPARPPPSAPPSSEAPSSVDAASQPSAERRTARAVSARGGPNSAFRSAPPVSMRPPAIPDMDVEPPSSRRGPDPRPDAAGAAPDRLCQLLREAQVLATALSFKDKPGTMVLLIRSAVFRAILEFNETLPDAVAHLYRSTASATRELAQDGGRRGSSVAIAEPALHVMERLVLARGQVSEEKPLHIDPLTSAAHAREHLGRYLREIERAPAEPQLRHFLALGALSELLVRTKLPAKTEQRLRDIIRYALRDGAKAAAIDLLMTALNRIVAQ